MNAKLADAMAWLARNSKTLGKSHKDLWLAIGPNGVRAESKSYAKIADETAGKNYLLIKVPKNPQAAFVY